MEVIVNPKTLDGGVNVIQLETAVGAAMKCFEKVRGINVPRSRFLPVKKTSDLFLIMSNLYTLTNGSLTMSPERMFQTTPLIKLGDESFKKVNFMTFNALSFYRFKIILDYLSPHCLGQVQIVLVGSKCPKWFGPDQNELDPSKTMSGSEPLICIFLFDSEFTVDLGIILFHIIFELFGPFFMWTFIFVFLFVFLLSNRGLNLDFFQIF